MPGRITSKPGWWKLLDGSALKLIAVVTMLIDHYASVMLRDTHIELFWLGSYVMDLYTLMRMIGRISFPIYAFLLVEGFWHTRSVKRYALSLLALALLSEIPWNLEHTGTLLYSSQNVIFTLLFGLLGIWIIREYRGSDARKACLLLGLLLLTIVFRADYGVSGFAFILVLYLFRDQKLYQVLIGCGVLSSRWKAGLAFIPINMYNGRRGFIRNKPLKYAFYLIYPVHLLLLFWLRSATVGY